MPNPTDVSCPQARPSACTTCAGHSTPCAGSRAAVAPRRAGAHDSPPWEAVYQQTRRWIKAVVHDLRELLQLVQVRTPQPTAAVLDSRTPRSTPRAATARATTGPSARRARKFTPPWTRLATSWRRASPPPPSRTARKSGSWPRPCGRRPARVWIWHTSPTATRTKVRPRRSRRRA